MRRRRPIWLRTPHLTALPASGERTEERVKRSGEAENGKQGTQMMRDIAHVPAMVRLTVVFTMGLLPPDMWAEEAGTGGVAEPTQVPVPTTPASTPETSAPGGPSAPQSSA